MLRSLVLKATNRNIILPPTFEKRREHTTLLFGF